MTLQTGLRAGAVGAAIAVFLTLVGIAPIIGPFVSLCSCFVLFPLLWLAAGVLAGYFGAQANPMQTAGDAAQSGAVAGAITALAAGLIEVIISTVQMLLGGTAQLYSHVPPETWQQLQDLGVDPNTFIAGSGVMAIVLIGGCCCIIGPLLAAGLGAAGGALSPSLFKRNP